MATHSCTLAWKIPWMEGPGRLQSMRSRSQTELSDFTFTFHFHALEKKMTTHSSVLVWRIPGTEEPDGLLSIGLHRVRHDWSDLACMHALEKKMATHSTVLVWRTPGTEEPGGLPSMGLHRIGHDWSDLAVAEIPYSTLWTTGSSTTVTCPGLQVSLFLSLCVFDLPLNLSPSWNQQFSEME